jgi:hypothetical protein
MNELDAASSTAGGYESGLQWPAPGRTLITYAASAPLIASSCDELDFLLNFFFAAL